MVGSTVVYKVDQPQVVEFESRTLAGLVAAPTSDRRAVVIDLRDDWPTARRNRRIQPGAADHVARRGASG